MPLYSIEGVNIRSRNFGEADKTITVFSREKGKIQAVAKGARRPGSKFGGRLELFVRNHYLMATGRTLDIISQCETIDSNFRIREDRDKLNAGFYIVKLVDIITEERQVNDALYGLLVDSLRVLESGLNLKFFTRIFEVKLSEIEGLMPTSAMLERKYSGLPGAVEALRGGLEREVKGLTQKDADISGRVFREILSDHTGYDLRKMKVLQ